METLHANMRVSIENKEKKLRQLEHDSKLAKFQKSDLKSKIPGVKIELSELRNAKIFLTQLKEKGTLKQFSEAYRRAYDKHARIKGYSDVYTVSYLKVIPVKPKGEEPFTSVMVNLGMVSKGKTYATTFTAELTKGQWVFDIGH